MTTTVAKFSHIRILIRLLTRCRCQSHYVMSKAALYQDIHRELNFPRLCMKLPQNGWYHSLRLLSTSAETDSASTKAAGTLISSLPYDTLDYSPHTYSNLLNEMEDKNEKGIPFKRPAFCRLMRLLDKQEHLDHDEAAILLDSTGIANVNFPDDKRAEFTHWVWNKIQDIGIESVKNDIHLFNMYMKVLLENKAPLSPAEIEAEIKGRELTPNIKSEISKNAVSERWCSDRDSERWFFKRMRTHSPPETVMTYHLIIASACERGDVVEISKQLKEMMQLKYPISARLYNTLIWGYCKAGYIKKAEEMLQSMGNLNLEADHVTYAKFLLGCAENGDFTSIKKYIGESGLPLDPHSSLELVVLLAKNGNSEKAYQVLDILKEKAKPNILDLARAVTSLLRSGHYELAFRLNNLLGLTHSGRFFADMALISNMPGNDIANFVKRGRQPKQLMRVIQEADFNGEFETVLELCQHLDKTDVLWLQQLTNTIHYYLDKGNIDDLLRLQPHIERMTIWEYVTAMNIIYSELRAQGRTCGDVVQILRDNNRLDAGEFNAVMVRILLIKEMLPVTKAEVEKMEKVDSMFLLDLFQSPLALRFLQKHEDWREVFEVVAELRKKRKSELNCYFIFEKAKKLLLKEDMPLEPLVDFMIENKLKVLDFVRDIYAPGVSKEKIDQIEIDRDLLQKRQYTPELELQIPEDGVVLRRHLEKAARNMDRRMVESILTSDAFKEDLFIDIPAMYAVIDMYTTLADVDAALLHVTELISKLGRPGKRFRLPPKIVLKVAVALWKQDRCEEALDILSNNPVGELAMDKQRAVTIVDCKRSIKQLLYHDQGPELKNRLVDVLVNNFMKSQFQESEDKLKDFLASEEEKQYGEMDKYQLKFQDLVKKGDEEELQRVVDLVSKNNPRRKVLYRLCVAYALEGKLLQAKKVLQLPGMKPDAEAIDEICRYFIEANTPISLIEKFQDVLKNTNYHFDQEKNVLYTLFRRTASDDLDKGLQFLESGFEAHRVQTPRKAYDYLDRAYKNAGKPVPFERPWWKEKEKYQARKIEGKKIKGR